MLMVGGGLAYLLAGKNDAANAVAGANQPVSPAAAAPNTGDASTGDTTAGNGNTGSGPPSDPVASPSGAPSSSKPPTTAPGGNVTIAKPKTLSGRPEVTDPQYTGIVDTLKGGMSDIPGAQNTVGGLYGTAKKQDFVVAVATEAPVDDPDQELAGTFLSAGLAGVTVTDLATVSPGPLGGAAKCGNAEISGINLAICGWSDQGSIGYVMWYYKSVGAAKGEFTKIRAQFEKSN